MSIPFTFNQNSITFFAKNKQHTIYNSHVNYQLIKTAILESDEEDLMSLINIKDTIIKVSYGKIDITTDDEVLFQGQPIPDYLTKRILQHYQTDLLLVEPLFKFAEKLMMNPTLDVREDLYKWLENGNMPICADGDFIAYKAVNYDYTPFHNGPYGQDQSIGKIVTQPRETCNDNRYETCSSGLHFCSYYYISDMSPDSDCRIIILKINPEDVVSIPVDYQLSKGRCCRFEVIGEVDHKEAKNAFKDVYVVNKFGVYDQEESENVDEIVFEEEMDTILKKNVVLSMIEHNNGNKSAAARQLGITRSKLYRILKD